MPRPDRFGHPARIATQRRGVLRQQARPGRTGQVCDPRLRRARDPGQHRGPPGRSTRRWYARPSGCSMTKRDGRARGKRGSVTIYRACAGWAFPRTSPRRGSSSPRTRPRSSAESPLRRPWDVVCTAVNRAICQHLKPFREEPPHVCGHVGAFDSTTAKKVLTVRLSETSLSLLTALRRRRPRRAAPEHSLGAQHDEVHDRPGQRRHARRPSAR